jgi:hypothetical protein
LETAARRETDGRTTNVLSATGRRLFRKGSTELHRSLGCPTWAFLATEEKKVRPPKVTTSARAGLPRFTPNPLRRPFDKTRACNLRANAGRPPGLVLRSCVRFIPCKVLESRRAQVSVCQVGLPRGDFDFGRIAVWPRAAPTCAAHPPSSSPFTSSI